MSDRTPFSLAMKLPYPVSANRYWRKVPLGGKKGNREIMVPSAEGVAYKDEVGWLAKQYGIYKPFDGRVRVDIELFPARPQDAAKRVRDDPLEWDNDVRRIDLDNARKVLYDAFTGVVFVDDRWVFKDSGEVMEPDGEARVLVRVSRYLRELDPQLAIAGT